MREQPLFRQLPKQQVRHCSASVTSRRTCGAVAFQHIGGRWYCDHHAANLDRALAAAALWSPHPLGGGGR